jgi:gamma-glutamyl-gamma-aminobutyrate hydrolase PuuD
VKVVAVSQRIDYLPHRNETRDALDQRLVTFLLAAGFITVPVPNQLHKTFSDGRRDYDSLYSWLNFVEPQAYLLSGGNDIGKSEDRDLTEYILLDHARCHQKPLLGICRGMQIMAHWAGVDLCPVVGHTRTRHNLSGEIKSEVNSYHEFSIKSCPAGYKVLAKSEDGVIEAIRHLDLPWEGWMWHPEREKFFMSHDIKRIKELFSG